MKRGDLSGEKTRTTKIMAQHQAILASLGATLNQIGFVDVAHGDVGQGQQRQ
jgi:hypothetical protein